MKKLHYLPLAALVLFTFSCDSDSETEDLKKEIAVSDDPVEVYQETKALIDLTQNLSSVGASAVPTDFDANSSFRVGNEFFCDFLEVFNSTEGCVSYAFTCTEDGDMLSTITYADGCTQAGEELSGTISVLTIDPFDVSKEEAKNIVTYDKLKIREGEINGTTTIIHDLLIQDAGLTMTSSDYSITKDGETIDIISSDTIFSGSILGEPPFTTSHDITFEATSSLGYAVTGVTTKELFSTSECKIDDTIDVFFPVEGTQELVVTGILGRDHELKLDYGNGTCDDTYTVTDEDGNVRTFDLRDDSEIIQ